MFSSPVFGYHPDAVREIIDFLAGREARTEVEEGDASLNLRKKDEIESFNLQILCQFIEGKIIAENQPAPFEVTPAFYDGHDGLEREIRDFYWKQLRTLPETYIRRTARKVDDRDHFIHTAQCLIEESLVTPIGRRCSMVDDFLTTTWEVDHDFLDTLVDTRLLRKELRLDDFYYEISHDTLLPAIIESRDERRRQEKADQEKEELQARLVEEANQRAAMEAQLKAIEERQRLARRVALFSLTTLVLMFLFGIWFMYNWVASVRKELEQAEFIVSSEAFHAGIEAYENLADKPVKAAVLWYYRGKDLNLEMAKVRRLHALYDTIVLANLIRGDSLFFSDDYADALNNYREAYDSLLHYSGQIDILRIDAKGDTIWRIQRNLVKSRYVDLYQRRDFALKAIIVQFRLRQRAAEEFAQAGVWGQALRIYREMEALLPREKEDLDVLKEEISLDEDPRKYVADEIRKCLSSLHY